jgi:signal transduction histidine kinase
MNKKVKIRLGGFVLAIVTLLALIVWVTFSSSQILEETRAKGRAATSESFAIGRHFQRALMDLNSRLVNLAAHPENDKWQDFETDWRALARWIDERHLSSPSEKLVLDQIEGAYGEYHASAERIAWKLNGDVTGRLPAAEFADLEAQTKRLLDYASQLAEVHRGALREALQESNRSLARLRMLLLGALFLLILFGISLAFAVYNQLIAPLQVKLVESQALLERQEKLASLGVLAAGVAHEIRNPLTSIKAWLFMHQRGLAPGSREHADAEFMGGELVRLERIVKDFLMFARPSEPELQPTPVEQPLREVRELLGLHLDKLGIKLEIDAMPDEQISIDPPQMRQVLINLVQNAADSIERDGTVTLRARTDRLRLGGRERDVVVLEVADTGKGIPPDVEKRLFDPFFSTKDTGTGLGLSIAARIVEKHGGALQYQTRMNRGATFGIVLPRIENHEYQGIAHRG